MKIDNFDVRGEGVILAPDNVSVDGVVDIRFGSDSKIIIGDYVKFGKGVKIVSNGGDIHIGDWTTIHDNTLILSGVGVEIGQHCWFGQSCVLDGTGGLKIDDGVRVGMYSQVWSHVAAGELIEGCTLFSTNRVHLEKDVWLVGSCSVGSGVKIGCRTICLNGSNITRDLEDNIVVSGSPAKRLKGVSFYKSISLDKKMTLLNEWLCDYIESSDETLSMSIEADGKQIFVRSSTDELIIFKNYDEYLAHQGYGVVSKLCVENKVYNKSGLQLEERIVDFLRGNKARFYYNELS
ncbi:acyltransferase [Dongshaea marina]|uniref:acyltransferase n=1 Tax=Dongshaea marina TaxID=2047966 RepID=UPI000D3E22E9|nr:hypothetical protein [Dongshaea marina]